jgi:hypothetical protein
MGSLGHLRRIGECGMRVLVIGLVRATIVAISLMMVLLSPTREEALQPVIIILPLGHIEIVLCR